MNKKIVFALIVVGLLAVSAVSAQNILFFNNDDFHVSSLFNAGVHAWRI